LAIERVNSNNDAHIQAIANRSVITEETTHNEPFEVTADATAFALKTADQQGRTDASCVMR
jgi:glycerol dehydrogenase